MAEPFLTLTDICKSYPGVQALDCVALQASPGEIIGLVGENGAGKSTLMKILGGVVQPTSGRITLDGQDHAGLTVAQSMAAGIAFVHQELNLFDNLDEPTSSLTMAETDRLLDVVRRLKAAGVCIIFVTHRLYELAACADRVVALRDGKPAGALARGEIRPAAMINLMIGRALKDLYTPPAAGPDLCWRCGS